MKKLILAVIALSSISLFAYEEGEYSCRNGNSELPNNTYTLANTTIGGLVLPVMTVNRYYKADDGSTQHISVKGLANVTVTSSSEIVSLNAIRLEFVDNKLQNCRE